MKKLLLLALLMVTATMAQNTNVPVGLCASTSASTTVYTCAPSSVVPSYLPNVPVAWTPDVTSTGTTPTLNLGPGAKTVVSATGTALPVGGILANATYIVVYDGTNLRLGGGPTVLPGGVIGLLANANLANPATTVNGQTCTLGSTCNVNSGAAAHSITLNQGNGSAMTGLAIGTGGRLLIDQGAGVDPAFSAMSQDCTISSAGAITCTKTNNVAFAAVATSASATDLTSGTLAGARLPATAVQTNQANTYSAGTQDFSASAHTLPALTGTTAGKPATCTVGEVYFSNNATAGQNLFFCTATNTWTQQLNSGGGGGLTIGTTTISGGATNAVLYGDGTVLQNASGVTRTAAGQFTFTQTSLGTTPADGVNLTNSTAAAAGAQQISPSFTRCGNGWKTTATAASQVTCFTDYVLPVQSTSAPNAEWLMRSSVNAGSLGTVIRVAVDNVNGLNAVPEAYIYSSSSSNHGIMASASVCAGGATSSAGFSSDGGDCIGVNQGFALRNSHTVAWSTGTDPLSTKGTSLYRVSDGIVGIGKGSTTANGLINLAGGTFYDPTASTGATALAVRAGAGDNATTAQILNVRNNSNTVTAAFSPNGFANTYGGVATAGWGTPAVYAAGRSTAQTAAVASLSTYTVGSADGTFIVSGNVNITASTTHSFTMTVTYTDETNTSRVLTLNFSQLTGTMLTAITNVQGVGAYEGVPLQIRCKASTSITFATTGTFTSVTYNAEGHVVQIG